MRVPTPVALAAVVVVAGGAGLVVASRTDESNARWRMVRIDLTSNVVVIQSQHGACQPFTRLSVRESPTEVRITVHQDDPPFWSNGACDDSLVVTCHRVQLERPLGVRRVTGPSQFSLDAPDVENTFGACP